MLKLEDLSYWERTTYFESLDFLIVGAGIVGCSTAFHLRKKYPDAKILVVERSFLPAGASTKNAGFACFGSVTELLSDLQEMSESDVWETVQKRWEGLTYLRELLGDQNLDFQQLGSWDLVDQTAAFDIQKINESLPYFNDHLARITGEKSIYSAYKNINQKFGFNGFETSFHNRLEGQIDTGKMMVRFHQILAEKSIHLLTGIEVNDIIPSQNSVEIVSSIGKFSTNQVAICVNGFARKFLPNHDVKPARAQVLITKPISHLRFEGTFHLHEGYYYFRNIHNRVLFGGGRNLDFSGETTEKIENTELIINELKTKLQKQILPNTPFEIDYSWAGIMGVGSTKKPIVERVDQRVVVGVRMGGMGVAIGSLVGQKVAQLC